MGRRIDWHGPAHAGPVVDRVADLVKRIGPVRGLYHLEDAEAVARTLAAEARERGQHETAAGLDRAANLLLGQQFELVERFA